MRIEHAEMQICRFLLGLYVLSLAFFDKAVFSSHDSPYLYVGIICLFAVLIFRKNGVILFPKAAFFWLFFLIALLLSSFSAISYEKILSNSMLFLLIIAISIIIYNLLRLYRQSLIDALDFYLLLSFLLSILAILQFIEFNFLHTFNLYLPPTNQQFILSGGPGAVVGGLEIFRATGTFAEPSWLAFYLVPALILALNRYLYDGNSKSIILALFIFLGLLCTLSFIGFIFSGVSILLLFFKKILYPIFCFKFSILPALRLAFLGIIMILVLQLVVNYAPVADNYIKSRLDNIALGQDSSSEIRMNTVNQAFNLFKHNPLFGIGAGNYQFAAESFLWEPAEDVSINSGFLLILAEMGILGFLAYGLILWQSLRPTLEIISPFRDQLFWLLITDVLLMIGYNWWFHPLLWFHLTIPLAAHYDFKRGS